MTHTPPVEWRTRRNTGTAEALNVTPLEGRVRIGARGIRVVLTYAEATVLAASLIDAIESIAKPTATRLGATAVDAAVLDELEDIHVELTEARIAAAAGNLALVRAWLDLSEKVIGGRITEYKQARLEANS
jgi:hypothetical protein